jgi:hypothetical protein
MRRARLIALLCAALAWAWLCLTAATFYFGPASQVGWGRFYGSIGAEDLYNVGIHPADFGLYADIRFRAQYTGTLSAFRTWLMGTSGSGGCTGGTSYCGGNCGIYTVGLFADDGSSGHFPSGYPGSPIGSTFTITTQGVGSTQSCTTSSTTNEMALRTWPYTQPTVTAGNIYHMVWKDTDATPDTNFTSVDFMSEGGPGSGCSPGLANIPPEPMLNVTDWNLLGSSNGTSWSANPSWTSTGGCSHNWIPTFDFTIGSHHQGFGYEEVGINANGSPVSTTSDWRCIGIANGSASGSAPNNWTCGGNSTATNAEVRETFTPSATYTVTSAWVNVARLSGTGNLTITLKQGASTVEAVTVYPGSVPIDNVLHWVGAPFTAVHTLSSGTAYTLELSTNTTTQYATVDVRDGNQAGYGFDNATVFGDGNSQYSFNGGSTWTNWGVYNTSNTTGDMQFFFTLQ